MAGPVPAVDGGGWRWMAVDGSLHHAGHSLRPSLAQAAGYSNIVCVMKAFRAIFECVLCVLCLR